MHVSSFYIRISGGMCRFIWGKISNNCKGKMPKLGTKLAVEKSLQMFTPSITKVHKNKLHNTVNYQHNKMDGTLTVHFPVCSPYFFSLTISLTLKFGKIGLNRVLTDGVREKI